MILNLMKNWKTCREKYPRLFIITIPFSFFLSFFLSKLNFLNDVTYIPGTRTRHEKKPIEDAFYAEQRSKREHKNQSSSRGQAKGSIVAILASKLLSLSPRLYIQFHLPRRLPSSSAHLSLVFNRKVECMEREEKEKKYIFIYLEESFAFILTTGQGSSTVKKKGIKNEEISIFAPGSTNVKSNFRHWNSKEGFSISRSFFFSPPPIFFFHPKLLFRSSWSFFLIVILHRFARRFGSTGIFIFRRYEWLARDCLAFSYTWEIRKVCNYWFSSFFFPLPSLLFSRPSHISLHLLFAVFSFPPFSLFFSLSNVVRFLHSLLEDTRSIDSVYTVKRDRRFKIDGPSSFNFRPDVLVSVYVFAYLGCVTRGNRFPFFLAKGSY